MVTNWVVSKELQQPPDFADWSQNNNDGEFVVCRNLLYLSSCNSAPTSGHCRANSCANSSKQSPKPKMYLIFDQFFSEVFFVTAVLIPVASPRADSHCGGGGGGQPFRFVHQIFRKLFDWKTSWNKKKWNGLIIAHLSVVFIAEPVIYFHVLRAVGRSERMCGRRVLSMSVGHPFQSEDSRRG